MSDGKRPTKAAKTRKKAVAVKEANFVITPTIALPGTFQRDMNVVAVNLGVSPEGSGSLHVLDKDESGLFTFSAAKSTAHRMAMKVNKDIRLPTLREARLMFNQRSLIGSFNRDETDRGDELYWCTSKNGFPMLINFVSGYEFGTLRSLFKHASLRLIISGKPNPIVDIVSAGVMPPSPRPQPKPPLGWNDAGGKRPITRPSEHMRGTSKAVLPPKKKMLACPPVQRPFG